EHTVFEAEIVGAILGLDIIRATPRLTATHLFIDCQPAISALQSPSSQPAQYLLDVFHKTLAQIRMARRSLRIHIHWVPGHEDIEGSDVADSEAKQAAKGRSLPLGSPIRGLNFPLPRSSAATIANAKRSTNKQW
ncbi:hypothetical protein SCHPADRAFT_795491, partial [Schizopora paradoxa]